jgi:hypothetical protein
MKAFLAGVLLLVFVLALGCSSPEPTPTQAQTNALGEQWARVQQVNVKERPTLEELTVLLGKPTVSLTVDSDACLWYEFEGLDDAMLPVKVPMLMAWFSGGKLSSFVRRQPVISETSAVHSRKHDSGMFVDGKWLKTSL